MSAWADRLKQRAADLAEGRAVVEPVPPEPEKPKPAAQAPAPRKAPSTGPPLPQPPEDLPDSPVLVSVTLWGRTSWMTPREYQDLLLNLDKAAEHNAKCKPRDKSPTPPRRSGPTRKPPSKPSSGLYKPDATGG